MMIDINTLSHTTALGMKDSHKFSYMSSSANERTCVELTSETNIETMTTHRKLEARLRECH